MVTVFHLTEFSAKSRTEKKKTKKGGDEWPGSTEHDAAVFWHVFFVSRSGISCQRDAQHKWLMLRGTLTDEPSALVCIVQILRFLMIWLFWTWYAITKHIFVCFPQSSISPMRVAGMGFSKFSKVSQSFSVFWFLFCCGAEGQTMYRLLMTLFIRFNRRQEGPWGPVLMGKNLISVQKQTSRP